jgi:hypothetical protein
MRRRWIVIGIVLAGAGFTGVTVERSHHDACTAGLGAFGSLTGDVARNCGTDNLLLLVATAVTILGLAVLLASMLIRQ